MRYISCCRRESGYCKIGWLQSSDTDSFKLSRPSTSYNGATGPSQCAADVAIILEGSNQGSGGGCQDPASPGVPSMDRYCGGRLNCYHNAKVGHLHRGLELPIQFPLQSSSEIISSRLPFMMGVQLIAPENVNFKNRGFYLYYKQYPC